MKEHLFDSIDCLEAGESLDRQTLTALIEGRDEKLAGYLFGKAARMREKYYGNRIYIRGLIEFTNYCKTTATTAGSEKETAGRNVTVWAGKKLWSAAGKVMPLGSGPLCSRGARTPGIRMTGSQSWSCP